jgi:hypothetical protein
MPSRLIEISYRQNRRILCLRETKPGDGEEYAALSYCWGGKQEVCTTKDTLPRHFMRINFADLPKSLQDAVIVTENLDLKLLWIDALCIVQDDATDKAIEIITMPAVCSQAAVTILASRAGSVRDGFLHMRNPYDKSIFEVPYMGNKDRMASIVLVPEFARLWNLKEPLAFRAWALQEKLLSPRILEYGSIQTRWICEGNRLDRRRDIDGTMFDQNLRDSFQHRDGTLGLSWNGGVLTDHREFSYDRWYEILEGYTQLQITFHSDRLLAIAGIAERCGYALQDEYLVGLWRSRLPIELLWHIWPHTSLPRPLEFQAPSWSWAAVNGTVSMSKTTSHGER